MISRISSSSASPLTLNSFYGTGFCLFNAGYRIRGSSSSSPLLSSIRHPASRLDRSSPVQPSPAQSSRAQPFALNAKASPKPPHRIAKMVAAANATCPGGDSAIPDAFALPIPQNINVMVRTGSNVSNHAMEVCCAPNRVQVTTGCPYLWCELPRRYFNESSDPASVGSKVSACLGTNFADGDSRGTVFQFNAGARAGTATTKQMGLWVLFVSGLISYLL